MDGQRSVFHLYPKLDGSIFSSLEMLSCCMVCIVASGMSPQWFIYLLTFIIFIHFMCGGCGLCGDSLVEAKDNL